MDDKTTLTAIGIAVVVSLMTASVTSPPVVVVAAAVAAVATGGTVWFLNGQDAAKQL
jgi:hypothetical protein